VATRFQRGVIPLRASARAAHSRYRAAAVPAPPLPASAPLTTSRPPTLTAAITTKHTLTYARTFVLPPPGDRTGGLCRAIQDLDLGGLNACLCAPRAFSRSCTATCRASVAGARTCNLRAYLNQRLAFWDHVSTTQHSPSAYGSGGVSRQNMAPRCRLALILPSLHALQP